MANVIDLTSDSSVAAVVSNLTELSSELVQQGVSLTPPQRKALLKVRPGAEQAIALVVDLAGRYQVTVPSYPLANMQADYQRLLRLSSLEAVAAQVAQTSKDDYSATASKVWGAAMTVYVALQALAARSPELTHELELLTKYFAVKSTTAANKAAASKRAGANSGASNDTGSTSAPSAPVTVISNPIVSSGGSAPAQGAVGTTPVSGLPVTVKPVPPAASQHGESVRLRQRNGERRRLARAGHSDRRVQRQA